MLLGEVHGESKRGELRGECIYVYMLYLYETHKWIKFLNNFLKAAAAFVGLGSSE